MIKQLVAAVTLALAVMTLPSLAGSVSKVHGKHYSLELDPVFDRFQVDQIPMNGGKPMSSSLFVGNYKNMDLKIWVTQMETGLINENELDKSLTETVKGAYDGMTQVLKKDYPSAKFSYDKVNKITQGGAPAREILFDGTFGGQKIEGFVVTIYKNEKITILMGGAAGLKSEFSAKGTKILDDTSDSLTVLPTDPDFHQESNSDFDIILPKMISLKVESKDKDSGLNEYEFTGSTQDTDMGFMFAVGPAKKNADKKLIESVLKDGLKQTISEYGEEIKMVLGGAKMTMGEPQTMKLNDQQGMKQTFTITKGGDEMKGEARMIYTGDKIFVLLAKTLGLKGSPDKSAVSSMNDSLDSIRMK